MAWLKRGRFSPGTEFAIRHGARRRPSLRRQHRRDPALSVHGGATRDHSAGVKVADLPGGPINHHWTKNIIASRDGKRLYATVGSNSNVGRKRHGQGGKPRRHTGRSILATGSTRVFASGLRNPNGLGWQPQSGALWTVVNERDELGSDLVPDYLTS